MKRIAFIVLILNLSVSMQAGSGYKTCRVCGGFGHPVGNSNIVCQGCNGRGQVPLSSAEQMREERDRENYAQSANDMMEQFNLTPQEFFAYEELVKQSMQQVPVYQPCTACSGTGKCTQCGGYMNVSIDDPLCRICGGSGQCIACRGLGQNLVGYQDNPDKELLIKRAKEILDHGSRKGNTSNAGGSGLSGYDSHDDVTAYDDDDEDEDSDDDSSSSSGNGISLEWWQVIAGIVGVGGLGWLLSFLRRK